MLKKTVTTSLMICVYSIFCGVYAQVNVDTINLHWPKYISLKDYLIPFMKADTIVNELILPIKKTGKQASANLLFPAKKILKVQDLYLEKEYSENKDWLNNGREIVVNEKSSIPFFKEDELVFKSDKKKEGYYQMGKDSGYYVLFDEGKLFPSHQLSVTYIPDRSLESGHLAPPIYDPTLHGKLMNTIWKLNLGESLKIVFYGNSIEVGGNSSGFLGVKPFMPNWTQLIVYNLRSHYMSKINYVNNSKGGMLAKWGVENAEERVANEDPDLVVIAFGMNDGTFAVPESEFVDQVNGIMKITLTKNPNCEFIIVTPMLANPLAIQNGNQEEYRIPILQLASSNVAIADVTIWHKWLLNHKSYQDMIGNNINHPNDYLARWYAHIVSAILIPENN